MTYKQCVICELLRNPGADCELKGLFQSLFSLRCGDWNLVVPNRAHVVLRDFRPLQVQIIPLPRASLKPLAELEEVSVKVEWRTCLQESLAQWPCHRIYLGQCQTHQLLLCGRLIGWETTKQINIDDCQPNRWTLHLSIATTDEPHHLWHSDRQKPSLLRDTQLFNLHSRPAVWDRPRHHEGEPS